MNKKPEKIPVLTGRMICRHAFNGPNGTRCLFGWTGALFEGEVERKFDQKMGEHTGFDVAGFNDDKRNSLGKIAAVFNRVARSLGYVRKGTHFVLSKRKARAAK